VLLISKSPADTSPARSAATTPSPVPVPPPIAATAACARLTRVAIPRSGSFLNTGGLTRYKSRAARRHSGKLGGGGGGGGG